MEDMSEIWIWRLIVAIFKLFRWKNLKWIRNRVFSPTLRVVVYGESGAGKTQFLYTILGNGKIAGQPSQNIEHKKMTLEDGHLLEFIVTPGHKSLKAARDSLRRELVNGKITGVINVVNYGYLCNEDTDLSKVFQAGSTNIKAEYLRDNKKRELDQIAEWIDLIDKDCKLKWLITIVNKADVWYDQRDSAMEYYKQGAYYEKIKVISPCCNNIECFPFCSTIHPFCDRPMLLNMSEQKKRDMHQAFYDELSRLASL